MTQEIQHISVEALHEKMEAGETLNVVDVRTPAEFQSVHIQEARCVPLDKLDPEKLPEQVPNPDAPIYVVCKSGQRSKQACDRLLTTHPDKTVLVEGGTDAWVKAGYPVERSAKKVLPLNQQVQITAGALVVLGVVLAAAVNPWFMLISGFVGCGLIMAGITGLCPMANLIAKMPWNQLGSVTNCDIQR